MKSAAIGFLLLIALGACSTAEPSPSADEAHEWTVSGPVRDLPFDLERAEGRPGRDGGTIFEPSSDPIQHGVAYGFSLGHCGLASPVDVDGSFWDPIEPVAPDGDPLGEMINATPGVIVVIGDESRFRTDSGAVVRFTRHAGPKEFRICA
jgi:hypothetical protein